MKWVHKKGLEIKGSLAKLKTFECNMCKTNKVAEDSLTSVNMAEYVIKKVGMFSYVGIVCVQKVGFRSSERKNKIWIKEVLRMLLVCYARKICC